MTTTTTTINMGFDTIEINLVLKLISTFSLKKLQDIHLVVIFKEEFTYEHEACFKQF